MNIRKFTLNTLTDFKESSVVWEEQKQLSADKNGIEMSQMWRMRPLRCG